MERKDYRRYTFADANGSSGGGRSNRSNGVREFQKAADRGPIDDGTCTRFGGVPVPVTDKVRPANQGVVGSNPVGALHVSCNVAPCIRLVPARRAINCVAHTQVKFTDWRR